MSSICTAPKCEFVVQTAVKHLQDENEEKARRTRATFMDPVRLSFLP